LEQNISTLDITESAQFFAQFHPEGFRIRDTCNKSSAPTRYSFGCCARAACGHAMAAPNPAINSRRIIASASGPGVWAKRDQKHHILDRTLRRSCREGSEPIAARAQMIGRTIDEPDK